MSQWAPCFVPREPGLSFTYLAARIIPDSPLPNLFEVLMAILHKLLFFLVLGLICAGAFALTLEFLGAGGYAQTKFDYTLDLAQQGNARAQVNLGLMYYQGVGVPRDYQEALKWYRKAAEQGYASAQNNLGLHYCNGQGVPRDYVLAHMWINLSHSNSTYENDRKQSTNLLNDLERKMTPKQLFEAQTLSREWKPTVRF